MGLTIIVNSRTVVHKESGGIANALPDVCKTPAPPAPPVPIPYPNIARSADTADGSKSVKMDGNPIMLKTSKFKTSIGDEAGTLKGIVSNTNKGIAKFVNYSFTVKVEKKNVPRLSDPMTNNGNNPNTTTVAELQDALGVDEINLTDEEVEELCHIICNCRHDPGPGAREECLAQAFSSGEPLYQNERIRDPLCEVGYDFSQPRPELIESLTGRALANGHTHHGSLPRNLNAAKASGPGNVSIVDLVYLSDRKGPADWDNVRQAVEIKFEGDEETHNQGNARANDEDRKRIVITEEHCQCT